MTKPILDRIDKRNKDNERIDFNCFYLKNWAAEAIDAKLNEVKEPPPRKQLLIDDQYEKFHRQLVAKEGNSHQDLKKDIEEAENILRIMRQTGTIAAKPKIRKSKHAALDNYGTS
jgi:hypothetical protein